MKSMLLVHQFLMMITFLSVELWFVNPVNALIINLNENSTAPVRLSAPVTPGDLVMCDTNLTVAATPPCAFGPISDIIRFSTLFVGGVAINSDVQLLSDKDSDALPADVGGLSTTSTITFEENQLVNSTLQYRAGKFGVPGAPLGVDPITGGFATPADTIIAQSDCSSSCNCPNCEVSEPNTLLLLIIGFIGFLGYGWNAGISQHKNLSDCRRSSVITWPRSPTFLTCLWASR